MPTSTGIRKTRRRRHRRRRETRNPRIPSGQVFDCPVCSLRSYHDGNRSAGTKAIGGRHRAPVMKIRQAFPRRTGARYIRYPSIVRAYTLDTHSSIELETIARSFLSERRGLRAPQSGFATDSFDTGCISEGRTDRRDSIPLKI